MVISKEKGPFMFKLHVFRNDETATPTDFSREDELTFMQMCDQFNAKEFKSTIEAGKLKIMFTVETNEDAVACYEFFHKNRKSEVGDVHIYMVNIAEEVYEKYGDEEAKKYEEE
jgi:hypothetical protein